MRKQSAMLYPAAMRSIQSLKASRSSCSAIFDFQSQIPEKLPKGVHRAKLQRFDRADRLAHNISRLLQIELLTEAQNQDFLLFGIEHPQRLTRAFQIERANKLNFGIAIRGSRNPFVQRSNRILAYFTEMTAHHITGNAKDPTA